MGIFAAAVDYFQRGGVCMWPLLLCSIVVCVVAVERSLYYKKTFSPSAFAPAFVKLINEGKVDEAYELAKKTRGKTSDLAVQIIEAREQLGRKLSSTAYAMVDHTTAEWKQYISALNLAIGLSPMLGLLGTITGMMASFNALNERLANPMAITAGIGEALITTVFGLCISIIAICMYAYFNRRLTAITLNVEEVANTLLEAIAKNLDKQAGAEE